MNRIASKRIFFIGLLEQHSDWKRIPNCFQASEKCGPLGWPALFIRQSCTMMTSWGAMGFANRRNGTRRDYCADAPEDWAAHLIDYCHRSGITRTLS